MTQQEFEAILTDATKRIEGHIRWVMDEDRSPAREFRAAVLSESDYPLFVVGRRNSLSGKLSYTLVYRGIGRIYALDLGIDHHNPICDMVGDRHKHYWTDQYRDKMAYEPKDITGSLDRPTEVWKQFCAEAGIEHQGRMYAPPASQRELFP